MPSWRNEPPTGPHSPGITDRMEVLTGDARAVSTSGVAAMSHRFQHPVRHVSGYCYLHAPQQPHPGPLQLEQHPHPPDMTTSFRIKHSPKLVNYTHLCMRKLHPERIVCECEEFGAHGTIACTCRYRHHHTGGRMFFHVLAASAQFEASLIPERTLDGLEAARARDRKGGHRPKLRRPAEVRQRDHTVTAIAQTFGVTRPTPEPPRLPRRVEPRPQARPQRHAEPTLNYFFAGP